MTNSKEVVQEIKDLLEGINKTAEKISRCFDPAYFDSREFVYLEDLEDFAKQLHEAEDDLYKFIDKYIDPDEWGAID